MYVSTNTLSILKKILAGALLAFAVLLPILSLHQNALAAFNKEINYQGKLTNASNVAVANGSYNIRFKLYTTA